MNRKHEPAPVDIASESVAGEEDPGASIDAPMSPGDEAPAGTPGTGERACARCGGSGKVAGLTCPECDGTGKVTGALGGA